MSGLKFPVVVRCTWPDGCNEFVTINQLETATPDPEGVQLFALFKAVASSALCPYHREKKQYQAQYPEGKPNWRY